MTQPSNAGADNSEKTALLNEVMGVDVSQIDNPSGDETKNAEEKEKLGTEPAPSDAKPESEPSPESPEKKPEGDEKGSDDPKPQEETQEKINRLDKRIVSKALANAALTGQELDHDEVIAILSTKSFEEKQKILKALLQQSAGLRGTDKADLTEEDIEALAEAKAEEKLAEREIEEAREAESKRQDNWHASLSSLISTNPELNEKDAKFNPVLAEALELMLSDRGNARYSVDPAEAWSKVKRAAGIAEQQAKEREERDKQESFSGALSGTGQKSPDDGYTLEEIERISQEDPELYLRLIRERKINL